MRQHAATCSPTYANQYVSIQHSTLMICWHTFVHTKYLPCPHDMMQRIYSYRQDMVNLPKDEVACCIIFYFLANSEGSG